MKIIGSDRYSTSIVIPRDSVGGMSRDRVIHFAVGAAVIFGAQRFLLKEVYVFACLIPFLIALYFFNSDKRLRNTLLLTSIFLSVDHGADAYAVTPSVVRYLIYCFALLALIKDAKLVRVRLIMCVFLMVFQITLSLVNIDLLQWGAFYRDVFLAFLLIIVLCQSRRALDNFTLDQKALYIFISLYLCSEVFNYFVLYSQSDAQYLSYNSTKSLIVFPALYLLAHRRLIAAIVLSAATLSVLAGYVTRMLPLSFTVILVGYFLFSLRNKKIGSTGILLISIILIASLFFIDFSALNFEANKATWFFYSLFSNVDSMDGLRALDSVRYDENSIFFNRNIFSILAGDGFGVGLEDESNILGYVTYDQSAFSKDEIDSHVYYGLHDVWVDVGLRFGIAFVVACLIPILRRLYGVGAETSAYAMFLLVLVFCAFYSTPGLISISFVGLAFRESLLRKDGA